MSQPANDDDVPIEELDRRIAARMRVDSAMLRRGGWQLSAEHPGIWDHADVGSKPRYVALELTRHYGLARGGVWPRAYFPEDGPLDRPIEGKVCTRCGEFVTLAGYHKGATTASGYRSECAECYNAMRRAKRAGDLDAALAIEAPVFTARDIRDNLYPGDDLADVAARLDVAPFDLVEWARVDPLGAEPILRFINEL